MANEVEMKRRVCGASNRDKAFLVSYIIVFVAFLYFSRLPRHASSRLRREARRSGRRTGGREWRYAGQVSERTLKAQPRALSCRSR